MRRILVIALIACVYAGCADRRDARTGPPAGPGPHGDGSIRVALPEAALPDDPRVIPVEVAAGAFDLAVLYGAQVPIDPQQSDRFAVARLEGWDRTYAMWLNPEARWTHDPTFRRWMAAHVDRDGIVDLLFAGQGSPAGSLTGDRPPDTTPPDLRPFSAASRPRLSVLHDASDEAAEAIASRLKADLDRHGLIVEIRAVPPDDLSVLALDRGTAALLFRGSERGPVPTDFPADPETLVRQDIVVPLVRLHAWSAVRDGLRGVKWGPAGEVSIGDAGWTP